MQYVNQFQSFQSVRITSEADANGEKYERAGQVGTYVGPGDEPGEVAVKFEGVPTAGDPFPAQVVDTFPAEAVVSL
jgi:hypothetical protein